MSCKDDGKQKSKNHHSVWKIKKGQKRLVSEDLNNISEQQHVFELLNGGTYTKCSGKTSSNDQMTRKTA